MAGRVTRRDHIGKTYGTELYRWTGSEQVRTVARDPEERRGRAVYDPVPREERPVGGRVAEGFSAPVMALKQALTPSQCYPERYPGGEKQRPHFLRCSTTDSKSEGFLELAIRFERTTG